MWRGEIFLGDGNRPLAVKTQSMDFEIRKTDAISLARHKDGSSEKPSGNSLDIEKLPTKDWISLAAFRPNPCGGAARTAFAFVKRRLAALDAS